MRELKDWSALNADKINLLALPVPVTCGIIIFRNTLVEIL
jgi:hypothetical protein